MADNKAAAEDPLAKRAEETERMIEFLDKTTFAGDQREASDELSMVDQHPADVADITMQRELDYTRRAILSEELQQVQHAMELKEQGRYGICEGCGQPIGKERLEARPQATLCIDCQRKHDGEARPALG